MPPSNANSMPERSLPDLRWLEVSQRPDQHNNAPSAEPTSPDSESGPLNVLTPIHGRIHCSATQHNVEHEGELDRIAIDNFLDTLAEIALAVARRRAPANEGDGKLAV